MRRGSRGTTGSATEGFTMTMTAVNEMIEFAVRPGSMLLTVTGRARLLVEQSSDGLAYEVMAGEDGMSVIINTFQSTSPTEVWWRFDSEFWMRLRVIELDASVAVTREFGRDPQNQDREIEAMRQNLLAMRRRLTAPEPARRRLWRKKT